MARILVVDDDISVRFAIRTILELEGHTVVLAACGHTGAAAIEAFAFDVAIVDIFMPEMDGLETIRAFRQSAPTLRIIVMSGYAFREVKGPAPDFVRMAVELGATCCLRKPFRAARLLQAVASCCTQRAARVA
jgi:CheY-like chemotaxis protein